MKALLLSELAAIFPETRRRYAGCLKKKAYPSPEAAEAARRRQLRHTREPLRVYPCEECGRWHLTHVPLTPQQRIDAAEADIQHIKRELALLEAEKARLQRLQRWEKIRLPFMYEYSPALTIIQKT